MEALIKELEEAAGPSRELDAKIYCSTQPMFTYSRDLGYNFAMFVKNVGHEVQLSYKQVLLFTSKIDDARALVPKSMAFTLGQNVHHHYWQASVNALDDDGQPYSVGSSGPCNEPAIALCIAALSALKHHGGGE